jgi:hypothetical protein
MKSIPKVFELPLQQIAVLNFTDKKFKICGELSDFVPQHCNIAIMWEY